MAASQELVVPVRDGGREFVFHIWQRELNVGLPNKVQYYWMNSAQLRRGNAGPNFRSCIDLWWQAVEQAGHSNDPTYVAKLVRAEFYRFINTSKGMQDVYVDAMLSRNVSKDISVSNGSQLSVEECQRLRRIATARDWMKIRSELEHLFLGQQPSNVEMRAFDRAAQAWIGNGIVEFKRGGQQALQNYLPMIKKEIDKNRKQSGIERVHRFLNSFSYECKISFYKCYSFAWEGILQWLKENHEPNVVGSRIMSMWHNQNRGDDNAENKRDVFYGQVLALHPLSVLMHFSQEHLTTIGQWFGHPEYDSIVFSGKQEDYEEYWQLVGSILIAAHEYNELRDQVKESRGRVTHVSSETASGASVEDINRAVDETIEQFAAEARYKCSKCNGAVKYVGYAPPDDDNSTVVVEFKCKACGDQMTFPVSYEEMRQVLNPY